VSVTRTLRVVLAFAILVVLHYSIRPLLAWRVDVDFLLVALLLVAVRVRPGAAAVIGFLTGIVADSLNPGSFGSGALAMTAVGFSASWLKAVFFADNIWLNFVFFLFGKYAFDLVYLLSERRVSGVELVMQALLWRPLSAAATAVAGVLIIVLLRPLLQTPTTGNASR
jgi:rod shape-determining protein MreD